MSTGTYQMTASWEELETLFSKNDLSGLPVRNLKAMIGHFCINIAQIKFKDVLVTKAYETQKLWQGRNKSVLDVQFNLRAKAVRSKLLMPYETGDGVSIYSRSAKRWYHDGKIKELRATKDDVLLFSYYNNRQSSKWVPASSSSVYIQPRIEGVKTAEAITEEMKALRRAIDGAKRHLGFVEHRNLQDSYGKLNELFGKMERTNQKYHREATVDEYTGLKNAHEFMKNMRRRNAQSTRNKQAPSGLVCIAIRVMEIDSLRTVISIEKAELVMKKIGDVISTILKRPEFGPVWDIYRMREDRLAILGQGPMSKLLQELHGVQEVINYTSEEDGILSEEKIICTLRVGVHISCYGSIDFELADKLLQLIPLIIAQTKHSAKSIAELLGLDRRDVIDQMLSESILNDQLKYYNKDHGPDRLAEFKLYPNADDGNFHPITYNFVNEVVRAHRTGYG